MVAHLEKGDWNTGMVEGIRALNGYLDGSMENLENEEDDVDTALIIFLIVIIGSVLLSGTIIAIYGNQCPKCKKKHALQRIASHVISNKYGVITSEVTYLCKYCGHQKVVKEKTTDPNYRGPRNGGPTVFMGGGGFGHGGGGFSGGSFGGGRFGGGGAGSRF
jgi:uncharacterized protein